MPSTILFFGAALALLNVVSASPLHSQQRKAFTLSQVERTKYLKNGAQEKMRTLRKYGVAIPESLINAAALRAESVAMAEIAAVNGSAPAVPVDQYDSLYLTPTQCGNSTVQLDFDTGSADLWSFSSLQAQSQLVGHDFYYADPAKEVKGASWKITYGDGSGASGKVYADKVVVGGVTVTRQAVEAATSVSSMFVQDVHTDGLLGLSFSALNTVRPTQQKTFFDNIKSQLTEPLFAVDLKYRAAGSYDFGFINKTKYTGEITWVDIDSTQGFWEFDATGYAVGNSAVKQQTVRLIGDTGTTLVYLPQSVTKAFYDAIPGSEMSYEYGGWVIPCAAAIPDFSLIVAGVKQTIPGKHIIYAPVQDGNPTCYGGIQDNDGIPFGILGDVFLKSKYVIHEDKGGKPRLGLAAQPDSVKPDRPLPTYGRN